MKQTLLNGRQAHWLMHLAPYDFTIHYRKGKLNPADGPSQHPDFMDETEAPDTAIAKLMPTLLNKLATATFGVNEQMDVAEVANHSSGRIQGADPCAVHLIRALLMQVITQSAARE